MTKGRYRAVRAAKNIQTDDVAAEKPSLGLTGTIMKLPEVDGVEVEMREVDGVVERELFELDDFREAARSPDV